MKIDRSHYTLHVKRDIGRVDLDAINKLETPDGSDTQEVWKRVRRWLDEERMYDCVPVLSARDCPRARMSDDDIDKMIAAGVLSEIDAKDVMGGVMLFTVPEDAKQRFRPIKHTKDINTYLDRSTLEKNTLCKKSQIVEIPRLGNFAAQVDAKAMFDQFGNVSGVSRRMCARRGDDPITGQPRYVQLKVLGMGQRQAVDVAQAALRVIADFPGRRSKSVEYVDNLLLSADTEEDLLHDLPILFERFRLANLTLNEDVTAPPESFIQTSLDFLGVRHDFTNCTTCLTDKTLAKVSRSFSLRNYWSWRDFAACMGVCWYSLGIIAVDVASMFPLLRFISETSKMLQEHPERWDDRAVISPTALVHLTRWYDIIVENKPRPVPDASAEPHFVVFTDASAHGWGYIAVETNSGRVQHHGALWSACGPLFMERYEPLLGRSTFTEPRALLLAACHLLHRERPCRVHWLTDSIVTMYAGRRGWSSHSFELNYTVGRLHSLFPQSQGWFHRFDYVPGTKNTFADALSRGTYVDAAHFSTEEIGKKLISLHAEVKGKY